MKKYTVRIYNYYNNVLKEYHHKKIGNAISCAKKFNRWWSDVIETETYRLIYVIDRNGVEIDYRNRTVEPF